VTRAAPEVLPAVLAQWRRDEAAEFRGWDFSHVRGRMISAPLPWDYRAVARARVREARSLLDMATGDGAVLASLGPFPGFATAIEGYLPNAPIAAARLAALGVAVVAANEGAPLPFAPGAFDLVLNRHGGFQPPWVADVLRPGGWFVTQQVGGLSLADLMAHFDAAPKWPTNTLDRSCAQFAAADCAVELAQEWRGKVTFTDVGAVIYFLRAVPWLVDDFSLDRFLPQLEALQQRLERRGTLAFTENRFLLVARRR
jgi:SAM-dependent methyltransferase